HPPPLHTLLPYTTLFRSSFRTTCCAASAASPSRHLGRSRFSTRLLIPRTSRNGTSCSAQTCAPAAPSIDSHSAPKRSYNASPMRSEEHTSELQSLRHLVC